MATRPVRYTHGQDETVLQSYRWRNADNSAAYLLGHLEPGMSLLDVGCGPGSLTADLASRVAPGHVTALDPSPEVLAKAQTLAEEQGVRNVEFRTGDVSGLDLPDDGFDVVHAHQLLHHLTDPVAALREMRRVCRPGGIVAARDGDFAGNHWYPDIPELDEWLSLCRRAIRDNGGEPDAGRRLLSWARAAGFTDITATASLWCHTTADDKTRWATTWAGRLEQADLGRQIVDSGWADPDDLHRLADGWRAWAAHPDAWFAVPSGEILCRA
ncbi:MAG: hypothetical protein QG608_1498 [Actinomycetota bacterium]|nr:hypothetical protein [Actinomycetota bacterium]